MWIVWVNVPDRKLWMHSVHETKADAQKMIRLSWKPSRRFWIREVEGSGDGEPPKLPEDDPDFVAPDVPINLDEMD